MNKLPLSSRPSVSPIHSFLLIFCLLSSPAHALEMRTVVKDFVTTEWTLECPDGEVLDLTTVGLTDQGIREFIQCLSQIESEVGVHISSKTVVKDFVVESDEIISTTNMSEEQVNKLKQIIDTHRIPSNPLPSTRPRIESVLLNGVPDSFIIALPDGCIIDLTDVPIDPQVLNELIQLIQQIERENGVHVTGTTTVKDGQTEKDRVIQITYLTPQQIEQLLQFFQGKGIALILWQKLVPIEMHGVFDLNGEHMPFNVTGEALIQLPPPDPQTGAAPVEIVALELKSIDPIDVAVGLDNPEQWQVTLMLEPVDHTGKLNLVAGQMPRRLA